MLTITARCNKKVKVTVHMVPTVRGSQGKSVNFKKSGKVRENPNGQGKSGNSKVPWCKS